MLFRSVSQSRYGGVEESMEEEESPEMETEDEISEMSPDEMEMMYEMLKKKLGK